VKFENIFKPSSKYHSKQNLQANMAFLVFKDLGVTLKIVRFYKPGQAGHLENPKIVLAIFSHDPMILTCD